MAEEKDTLLFEVILDVNGVKEKAAIALTAITELKRQKIELEKTFKGNQGAPEFGRQMLDLNAKLKTAEDRLRSYEKSLVNTEKAQQAAEGSMQEMGAQIAILTAQYTALGETDRNSKFGITLKNNLKSLSDEYKELYSDIGKDQLNVGNYADTLLNATQATQGFAGKIGELKAGLSTAREALNAAKVGLTGIKGAIAATGIGLLLLALNALYTYLTKTKAGMEVVEKATRTVGSVIGFFTDKVAGIGKSIFEAFTSPKEAIIGLGELLTTSITNRLKAIGVILRGDIIDGFVQLVTGVTDATGRVSALNTELQSTIDANENLHKANKKLEDDERALEVQRARSNAVISEQKFIADDVTKSIETRIAAAKRAFAIEDSITKKQIALEKQRIGLIQQEGKLNGDGPDDDKLAEAQKKQADLEAQSKDAQKKLNNQINALQQEGERARIELLIANSQKELDIAQRTGVDVLHIQKRILDQQLQLALVGVVKGSQEEKKLRTQFIQDLATLNTNAAYDLQEKQNSITSAGIQARLLLVKKGSAEEFDLLRELADLQIEEQELTLAKQLGKTAEYYAKLNELEKKRTVDRRAIDKEQAQSLLSDTQASTEAALSRTKANTRAEQDQRLNLIRESFAQQLLDAGDNAEKQKDIFDRMNRAIADAEEDFRKKQILKILDAFSSAASAIGNLVNAQIDGQTRALDDQQKAALSSAALSAEAREAIEVNFQKKREKLEKEAAEKKKKIALVEAVIGTAKSIVEASPNPFLMALAAAVGALQIGVISSQQFARGGIVDGPSHGQGGVKYQFGRRTVELEGNEGVINKRSMAIPGVREIASQLNQLGGGVAYPGITATSLHRPRFELGGILPQSSATIAQPSTIDFDGLNRVVSQAVVAGVAQAVRSMPNPVVDVKDVARVTEKRQRVITKADS